jgi:hypothetical protein
MVLIGLYHFTVDNFKLLEVLRKSEQTFNLILRRFAVS